MSDLWATLRALARRPAFAIAAALSLALGIALATVVFSMLDATLLRPLPFPGSQGLVTIATVARGAANSTQWMTPSITAREAIVAEHAGKVFQKVAAVASDSHILGANGDAQEYGGVRVSATFFELLRVRPLVGRLFEPADGQLADPGPVVISQDLWRSRFGSDSGVVGRTIVIDGVERRVIGVVPSALVYPQGSLLWTLIPDDTLLARSRSNASYFITIGRLAPGVTSERAATELAAHINATQRALGVNSDVRAVLAPLASLEAHSARDTVEIWIAAAIVVLLLCAVNFATMMLSRGMQRRAELAVRSACGASPGRLVITQLLEAGSLAALGGLLAAVLALAGMHLLRAELPLPIVNATRADIPILAFVATTIVGMAFALLPAIELARTDLRPLLSGGSTKATTSDREMRGRRGLVALQVAMAVACVAVVVAVVQGQLHDFAGGPGYAYKNVLTGQLHPLDSATWSDRAFVEQLRSVEGVSDVAIVHNHEIGAFLPAGAPPGIEPHVGWSDVTPNYFTTVGPTLVAGRLPTQSDVDAGARVALVSERVLHWLWCDKCDRPQVIPKTENFLGRTLTLERPNGMKEPFTVIGVVSDVLTAPKFSVIESPVYTIGALRSPGRGASLVMRLHGNREQAAERVRDRLRRDKTAAVISDVTLASHDVDQWYADERGKVMFLVGAACFALFLALIGVYSLTAHTAALRTREFGIRLALGATNGRVVGMLVREIWSMATLGAIAGLLLASRVIRTLDIYLRNPFALHPVVTLPLVPVTLAAAGLLVIAVMGTVLPARRALRMDIARVVTSET